MDLLLLVRTNLRFKAWITLKPLKPENKKGIALFTSDTSEVHQKMAASEQETLLLKRNHQFARLKRL